MTFQTPLRPADSGDAEAPETFLGLRAARPQEEVSVESPVPAFPVYIVFLTPAYILLRDGTHLQAPQHPRSEPETGTPQAFSYLSPGGRIRSAVGRSWPGSNWFCNQEQGSRSGCSPKGPVFGTRDSLGNVSFQILSLSEQVELGSRDTLG